MDRYRHVKVRFKQCFEARITNMNHKSKLPLKNTVPARDVQTIFHQCWFSFISSPATAHHTMQFDPGSIDQLRRMLSVCIYGRLSVKPEAGHNNDVIESWSFRSLVEHTLRDKRMSLAILFSILFSCFQHCTLWYINKSENVIKLTN